jgi:hypothetical protein
MAKPAERALAKVLEKHPAAVVVRRHETSLVCDLGDDKRASVSQIRLRRE